MNVIYTGNFSINWDYFKGIQSWQIHNLFYLQKYCDRHGIALKVIDNSNKALSEIFSYVRQKSEYQADAWGTATLASIVAMHDFLTTDYDRFAWMDLDICIIKPGLNIFDYLTKDFLVDYAELPHGVSNRKQRFIENLVGLKHRFFCNTSMIITDKLNASRAILKLQDLKIDIYDAGFLNKAVEFYSGQKEFMSDECLIESLLNSDHGMNMQQWPAELISEVISPVSHRNYWLDRFSYHFASESKHLIPEFWQEREVY